MMFLQQLFAWFFNSKQTFSEAALRFAFFWKLHDVFEEFEKSLMFFLEKKLNSNKLNSTCGNGRTSDEFVLCRCLL